MAELWGILLAAGSSTRLKKPKQLVDVAGESALKRSTRLLEWITGRRTIVVLGCHHERLRRELRDLHSNIVFNPEWKTGMASSLKMAIHALPRTADGALIMTCDQLQLETADLQRLVDEWQKDPTACVAARYADTLGVPVIFPRSQFGRIDTLDGDNGAKRLINGNGKLATIDLPHAEFDLDTPEDLDRLQEHFPSSA
ncbi:MAG: nucleotidyltransferase family protein [Xanthomonadales bacterium]|nr:nucleotidyltransferase family protein [Xanthomonadales bacterium]